MNVKFDVFYNNYINIILIQKLNLVNFTLIADVLLCCSIGSLGAGDSKAQVSNVLVNRATFTGTTNGVRIKTWQVINCV